MPFAYNLEAASHEIPSLGSDYSKAYGYAQDHHTLELNLLIWFAHTKDVLANGTPSDCRRFIDLPTCFWNKLMGNVDIVRKMLKKRIAVRGCDSGPGSLLWLETLGYAMYNGNRLLQHTHLEHRLDAITAFKEFQKRRQAFNHTSFLFKIANGDSFGEMVVSEYFPGLREEINHRGFRKASAGEAQASSTETQNQYKTVQCDSDSIRTKLTSYKKVGTRFVWTRALITRKHQ